MTEVLVYKHSSYSKPDYLESLCNRTQMWLLVLLTRCSPITVLSGVLKHLGD